MRQLVLLSLLSLIVAGAPTGISQAAPKKKNKLRSKDIKKLQKEGQSAANKKDWDKVAEVIDALSAANKSKVWKFILKLANSSPPQSPAPEALLRAAKRMDDKRVQKAVRKAVKSSRNSAVRRLLLEHFAARKDWDPVISALDDRDEEVGFLAVWHLSRNQVEEAVEPMIKAMEALDKDRDGIWYELRKGLARLLGKTLNSGFEYRGYWKILSEEGGLSAVKPEDRKKAAKDERLSTEVRFFGREIDSNRIVFILDVSGSMRAVDRPRPGSGSARRGDPGGSSARGGKKPPPPKVKLKNRLQRAQEQLKRVINRLPPRTRVNIITYASKNQIKMWRDKEAGHERPLLHRLTKANRDEICRFVDGFVAAGATATDVALRLAYSIKGARTFYLLSDGVPSHGHPHILPDDAIWKVVDEEDRGRKVVIHTLGFRGAPRKMMEGLATRTGGKYSDIPDQ